ncbi:MAG: zinc transporter ZupT [Candidatus Paceibacteria bacterium]|jgi:zinc transporter ZupT
MENIHLILISGLLISLVSILGVVLVKSHPKIASFVNHNLRLLTAISAGVFLVTSFILASETLELLPLHEAIIAFTIGVLVYMFLHKILSPHRHEGSDHVHDHKKSAWKILIGDAIHNIADGMLLVASFGVSAVVGANTALSIILHEAPQEISEFLVLRKSGYSNIEAVYRNVGTALTIFVGIALGLLLIQTAVFQAYLLGATATFFLGIVFTDLFPVQSIIRDTATLRQMFAALAVGILIMTGVTMSLGHSHEHTENDHEYHHIAEHDER